MLNELSLLSELRAATSERHSELDRSLDLLEGSVTKERYAAFLRGSLSALRPLEASLSSPESGAPEPSRCTLIAADLAALGEPARAPEPDVELSLSNPARRYGARYVIEGSALGGAVLARAVASAPGVTSDSLRYLTLHGERLGEHWRAFTGELETWGKSATREMRSDACDAARGVFDLYRRAFELSGALKIRQ